VVEPVISVSRVRFLIIEASSISVNVLGTRICEERCTEDMVGSLVQSVVPCPQPTEVALLANVST